MEGLSAFATSDEDMIDSLPSGIHGITESNPVKVAGYVPCSELRSKVLMKGGPSSRSKAYFLVLVCTYIDVGVEGWIRIIRGVGSSFQKT